MLEEFLRDHVGRQVHLFYPPGINVTGRLEAVDPMGTWAEITNGQGLRGVLRLEGIMLAEEAPPAAMAVARSVPSLVPGQR